jgi:DNA-binding response OmpR family regulator
MTKACILLVDDEPDLVWAVQRSLNNGGFEVLTAGDGFEALDVARRHSPALVILDIVMPYLDGLEVCRRMRLDPILAMIPILFLTVRSAVSDRVLGLEEGGDDYLVKPFDLQELKARIHALLRRVNLIRPSVVLQDNPSRLVIDPLTLDLHARRVWVGEKATELTSTEFDLLYFLMTHAGNVFTAKQLLQQVWNYPPETAAPSLVRWHVKNLRAKIELNSDHPIYIRTLARQGFMLDRRGS